MKVHRMQPWQYPQNWEWFGHAAHLIVGDKCWFHLATKVGPWLVSSVGEYHPKDEDECQEISAGRKYETMVFKAGDRCTYAGCNCGLPDIDGMEEEYARYDTAGDATKGHMAMCMKYACVVSPTTEESN